MTPDRSSSEPPNVRLQRRPRPGGFSLIEATVAVVLLIAAMTTVLQAVSWMLRARDSLDRRAIALREVEHQLDRLTSSTSDPSPSATLSPDLARLLSHADLTVDRQLEQANGISMQRITISLRYDDRPGMPAAPIHLSTWIAPPPEPSDTEPGERTP